MGIVNILATAGWPSGLWESIIGWFYSFIGNYGWTIIAFTVALKIILLPLDFVKTTSTRKTMDKQAILKPKLDALTAKYGNNKEMLNKKQMELYQNEGVNPWSGCVGILVMLLSLVIFITVFASFNNISHTRIQYQYQELRATYEQSITLGDTQEEAQTQVLTQYEQIREGWLWVNNIWRPDTWVSKFPSFTDYVSSSGLSFTSYNEENPYLSLDGTTYTDSATAKTAYEADYNTVTAQIQTTYTGWNGYLILVLLTGAVTFLSIYFGNIGAKSKNKKGEEVNVGPQVNKTMLLIFPILMLVFTIWYSSAFALYILVNNATTILFNYLINLLVNKLNYKKDKNGPVVDYARK